MIHFLLIGAIESLFFTLLLLLKKNKNKSDKYLGFLFLINLFSMGSQYFEILNQHHQVVSSLFVNISWTLLFLHGPVIWFYIQSLTRQDFTFHWKYVLHFIPFIIFLTMTLIIPGEKYSVNEVFRSELPYIIGVIAVGLSMITYNLWALIKIVKLRRNIVQQYSNIEDKNFNWLRLLTVAALICYSLNVILFNLDNIFRFTNFQNIMIITYCFGVVYIFVLGFYGIRQGNIFVDNPITQHTEEAKKVILGESKDQNMHLEFRNSLSSFMDNQKPYLDPGITLRMLSKLLDVKPEYLSMVLNTCLEQNFFDFINSYRVREFKVRCAGPDIRHLSILGLAYECGFNSKASFYRAFKKATGIAPTGYINSVSL